MRLRLAALAAVALGAATVAGRSTPASACLPAPPAHHWVRIAEEWLKTPR